MALLYNIKIIIKIEFHIYDYNDEVYQIIPASGVTRIKTGIYKITVNVDSEVYPDAVIFKDIWNINVSRAHNDEV